MNLSGWSGLGKLFLLEMGVFPCRGSGESVKFDPKVSASNDDFCCRQHLVGGAAATGFRPRCDHFLWCCDKETMISLCDRLPWCCDMLLA